MSLGRLAAWTFLLAACAPPSAREWTRAERLWRERDPSAHAAWRALDPRTGEGARAHERLAQADARFRRGIELYANGNIGARAELSLGHTLAPMDPALYLPLARACRGRDLPHRAAEFYRKFLKYQPDAPEAAAARTELLALDEGLDAIFDPPRTEWPLWPFGAGAALLIAGALGWRARRRRETPTLAELAHASPELQPAIAFLVGCLRHELLKQRVLVAQDAIASLQAGTLGADERRFLFARLFHGEPLTLAWAGVLASFMRALGPRFDLARNDPSFRAAGRAIDEIGALEGALAANDAPAAARLARCHGALAEFDRTLAALLAGLTHTTIDEALLRDVVAQVARELPGSERVTLTLDPVPAGVAVEVYRMDLRVVLANLFRNAVAAALRAPAPPQVAVRIAVALLPTGEEVVRICVSDTNPELLPLATARDASRGLGLVTAALSRYDGCLEQGPAAAPFAKSVTARLFRALDAETEAAA